MTLSRPLSDVVQVLPALLLGVVAVLSALAVNLAAVPGDPRVIALATPWGAPPLADARLADLPVLAVGWGGRAVLFETTGHPDAQERIRAAGFVLLDASNPATCATLSLPQPPGPEARS